MKKAVDLLKDHIKSDFSAKYYLFIAIFLTITISINYYLDFEDTWLDKLYGKWYHIFALIAFYGFSYYGAVLIQRICGIKIKTDKRFWFYSLAGLAILSLDISFSLHRPLLNELPSEIRYFSGRVFKNLISIFTVVTPLYILYRSSGVKSSFYGLTLSGFDKKPYLYMLFLMLLIISISLFTTNLDTYYPLYRSTEAHNYWNVQEAWLVLIHEFAYGFDFITIELLFRGFMVVGMAKLMGRHAIIPMTVVYCFIHFGKPAAETVSSIFGGYIIGVFAYYTRSIFGGIILHVGTALGMEALAFLKKSLTF